MAAGVKRTTGAVICSVGRSGKGRGASTTVRRGRDGRGGRFRQKTGIQNGAPSASATERMCLNSKGRRTLSGAGRAQRSARVGREAPSLPLPHTKAFSSDKMKTYSTIFCLQ